MDKDEIKKVLEKEFNLEVISPIYSKCFDFLVRKNDNYYFIKIYKNINSLNNEISSDLVNLEKFLNTTSIVISEKTSRSYLNDFVYFRKNIRVFNFRTFFKFLENMEIPIFSYGKIVANIDYELMKRKRIQLGFSLSLLAKKLKISKKHLYEIEIGKKRPSYLLAKKIEKILDEKLIVTLENRNHSDNKVFNFYNFCSIKGIKNKNKRYIIPRDDSKALEESEEIAKIFNLKIL